MKRTTYIIIGLILASFVGFVVFLFICTWKVERPPSMRCTGDPLTMDASGIKTLRIVGDKERDEIDFCFSARLAVTSAQPGEKATLTYPQADYLQVSRVADTLLVSFHADVLPLDDKVRKYGYLLVEDIQIQLQADAELNTVASQDVVLDATMERLTLDSLAVNTSALLRYGGTNLKVDSCSLRSLFVVGGMSNHTSFSGSNSRIENLHLGLNAIGSWILTDCDVDTEYLSGYGNNRCSLEKGECKQMIWQPGNENSELQVTLKEPSKVLVR